MRGVLAPALAGAAATCSGIGLARFAYVPLFPAMVAAGWVDGAQAGLLGALNLTGYLAGALLARIVARRVGVPRALDAGMALAALAAACCAWNGGMAWLAAWRAVAGAAGGLLMGLAGPAVQAVVPAQRRGIAGGLVLMGVGTGVTLGALLVPALVGVDVAAAWLGLSAATLLLWGFARPRWPAPPPAPVPARGDVPRAGLLIGAYALSGAGLVPPMVYLADFAARGHGLGVQAGGLMWVVFGAGALVGSVSGGALADRIGGRRAMVVGLAAQAVALALPLLPALGGLVAGGFLSGAATVGITAVALVAARERAGAQAGLVWVRVTAGFALAQAATGFAMAALFGATGESHAAIFAAGAVLSVGALALGVADRRAG
ncbi:YbfB/YjiJ family MFS transporter [Roseomonas sp. PWR1]|uniref:YbfB/YjiJ family MFS transporter n=1 Tax=Roseomonas nitratireducens TaxID=2820810 RepID=A0ABS4AMN6_9PROT|nr:YbfB/YjiJ family MFS transporter [Neoroseomonas nitratireducens]MBP0462494.1 YbfB/YjiJ family MFS transporter [Neoroseomonas nitratireducens]